MDAHVPLMPQAITKLQGRDMISLMGLSTSTLVLGTLMIVTFYILDVEATESQ